MTKTFCLFFFSLFIILTGQSQINIDTASFYSAIQKTNSTRDNFIVIGEVHEIKNTFNTEFFIIKHFAEKGYKTIFIESGQSEAAILNMYLQSGDTTLFKYTRGREESGNYKKFLYSIYQLNKEKQYNLVFKAFDFERAASVGYLFSKWFGETKVNSIDFKKLTDSIFSFDEGSAPTLKEVRMRSQKLKITLNSLKLSFSTNENQYKELLKDNFTTFKSIVFNPCFGDSKNFNSRDYYFNNTLLEAEQKGTLSQSILIVGSAHVIGTTQILRKNGFIPLFAKYLPKKYSLNCFIFTYRNCRLFSGSVVYNSNKRLLKCLSKTENNHPLINFSITKRHVIPTKRENMTNVIIGMYNQ